MKLRDQTQEVIVTIIFVIMAFFLGMAVASGSGQEDWTQEMNEESYWEDRLGVTECKKFDGHNGYIPQDYDFVIVKGGQWVVIYSDVQAGTTLDGPIRPSNGKEVDISWVTKCKGIPPTTVPTDSTTTTVYEETTTSLYTSTTVLETTTTVEDTTTSTVEPTTTTVVSDSTTTSTEEPTTTAPPEESTTSLRTVSWSGTAECDSLSVEFGEGIREVDILMDDFTGGGSYHTVSNPFLESGSKRTVVGSPTRFALVPVLEEGYVAFPVWLEVTVEPCPQTSETPEQDICYEDEPCWDCSTMGNMDCGDEPVLPFTGINVALWAALGVALVVGGGLTLWREHAQS